MISVAFLADCTDLTKRQKQIRRPVSVGQRPVEEETFAWFVVRAAGRDAQESGQYYYDEWGLKRDSFSAKVQGSKARHRSRFIHLNLVRGITGTVVIEPWEWIRSNLLPTRESADLQSASTFMNETPKRQQSLGSNEPHRSA